MFSTTIIASSTTIPTESTMARSVSKLIVNPSNCMRKIAPINEMGIAMMGTSTVRIRPMNMKITNITMTRVSTRVEVTSLMASSI